MSSRNAPLDMGADEFRRIGHTLVDQIAGFLDGLPNSVVTPADSLETVRGLIDSKRGLPDSGADAAQLVKNAAELLFSHSLLNGNPHFWGYITSSAAPIGAFGDMLAAAVNPNVGAWKLAPLATEIEAQTIRWLAEFMGYPVDCGGLLASGGNMANVICLQTARTAKAGQDSRKHGVGDRRMRVYASKETHTWLQKAMDMLGLGTEAIRWISVDESRRMRVDELERCIREDREKGHEPFAVVGTAGSVSTGAVDPLGEIAAICRAHGLWFHVDGAYGGLATLVPGAPKELLGLSEADSVAVDPHKWLYAPLEAGCVLVRDPRNLLNAFSYQPPYYNFQGEATNYFDFGPQNSRGFRALKVWLALQQAGRAGYRKMLCDDMRLSQRMAAVFAEHPEFEVFTQALSIATFRYVPQELRGAIGTDQGEAELNRINQQLLNRLEKSGEAFLSNAVLDGKFVLRACIVNFRTSLTDVEALPWLIARLAKQG